MGFVTHWHESAMDLHVFPIPIPPPTSLSTQSLWVFPVHQARTLVSCIQPGLVICFITDNIHVSMLFSRNIPPSPSPTESKSLFWTWKQLRCPSADEWIRKLGYIYTMEYYSAIKKNSFESVLMRWMKLEPIIQSEVSQKDKEHYSILTHIYGIYSISSKGFLPTIVGIIVFWIKFSHSGPF